MKLKEIKEWVNSLPEEFIDYNVVCSENGILDLDKNYSYRLDKSFIQLDVDEENKEILFFVENMENKNNEIKKFDNFE
jgi:hypothetical protein